MVCILLGELIAPSWAAPCHDLLKLITTPKGRSVTIQYIDSSRKRRRLTAKSNIEKEARWAIQSFSRKRSFLDRSVTPPREIQDGIEIRDLKELTALLLMWKPKTNGFRFAPLGQDETIAHGEWVYDKKFINPEYRDAPFSLTIYGGALWIDNVRELTSFVDFHVNAQRERALYFDSQEAELASAGVALRQKYWYRHPENGSPEDPHAATSLTVKKELGSVMGFHLREEWSLRLPVSIKDKEVPKITQALLKAVGIKVSTPIVQKKEIENLRLGINWYYKKLKIGFALIDSFWDIENPNKVHAQVELEVLNNPQVAKFLKKNGDAVGAFLKELKNFVRGENFNAIPKLKAVEGEPKQEADWRIPEGPLQSVYFVETRRAANEFELHFLSDTNELHRIRMHGAELMFSGHEPAATAKVENGCLYIRRRGHPWIEVARLTEDIARFIDETASLGYIEGHRLEILRPEILQIEHMDDENWLRVDWPK